jgi:hypothetical protein
MEGRRWKTDLQKDFDHEVPDLFFDLHDGIGWTPFEYVRTNPMRWGIPRATVETAVAKVLS